MRKARRHGEKQRTSPRGSVLSRVTSFPQPCRYGRKVNLGGSGAAFAREENKTNSRLRKNNNKKGRKKLEGQLGKSHIITYNTYISRQLWGRWRTSRGGRYGIWAVGAVSHGEERWPGTGFGIFFGGWWRVPVVYREMHAPDLRLPTGFSRFYGTREPAVGGPLRGYDCRQY